MNFPKYKQQLELILCSCLANCHCHTTIPVPVDIKNCQNDSVNSRPNFNREAELLKICLLLLWLFITLYHCCVHPSRLFPKHCTCKLLISRQPPTPKSLTKSQLWSAKNYNKLLIIYTVLPRFERSAHVVSLEMSIHPARLIQIKMDILPL